MSNFLVGGVGQTTFVQGEAGTYYRPLHGGLFSTSDGTESPDRETLVDAAYTGITIRVDVGVNSEDVAHTLSLRVNQTTSALSASIPANTTGERSDTASVAISSGDDVSIELDLTGDLGHDDTIRIDWWTFEYTGTGDSTWIAAPRAALAQATNNYIPMHGGAPTTSVTGQDWEVAIATTIENSRAVVTQNNIDGTSAVDLMEDGLAAIPAIRIDVTANTTGLFSETTQTHLAAAGENLGWRIGVASGMGGDTLTVFSVSCRSSADAYATIASYYGSLFSASLTQYFGAVPTFPGLVSSTESDWQVPVEVAETVDRGAIGVLANPRSTTTTFTLRDDGVDTNIVLSVSGSTTGLIQDLTNSHDFVADDLINWKTVSGTGGESLEWSYLSVDLPQQALAVIPPGLGPVVHEQEPHHVDTALLRY